jgi:hypothetical protein
MYYWMQRCREGHCARPVPGFPSGTRGENPCYLTPDQYLADQSVHNETPIGAKPPQPDLYRRAGEHASATTGLPAMALGLGRTTFVVQVCTLRSKCNA